MDKAVGDIVSHGQSDPPEDKESIVCNVCGAEVQVVELEDECMQVFFDKDDHIRKGICNGCVKGK